MSDNGLMDAVLRFHVRLDGVALNLLQIISADIDAALSTVEQRIAERLGTGASFTSAHLDAARAELVALKQALAERLAGALGTTLDAVAETSASNVADALDNVLRPSGGAGVGIAGIAVQRAIPLEMILQSARDAQHDGASWQRWGARLADEVSARLGSQLRQALAAGETLPDIRQRFAATASLSRTAASRLARTAVNATANTARVATVEAGFADVIAGWLFLATLDGRTSAICAALDGTEYPTGTAPPTPPRHPNCRSALVPITKFDSAGGSRPWVRATVPQARLASQHRATAKAKAGKAWAGMSEKDRRTAAGEARRDWQAQNIGTTPASTSYAEWLSRQPDSFQDETLGPDKATAFRAGLPLTAMATPDRALTVEELRRLYPAKFAS